MLNNAACILGERDRVRGRTLNTPPHPNLLPQTQLNTSSFDSQSSKFVEVWGEGTEIAQHKSVYFGLVISAFDSPRRLTLLTTLVLHFAVAAGIAAPLVARDELPERLTVATWNVEWFFDNEPWDNQSDLAKQMSAPSSHEWQWRLDQVARVIGTMKPTILTLQEIENRQVLYQLCQLIEDKHQLKYRIAFIPGYDFGTEQQVAILYRSGLVEFSRREQSKEMFDSGKYYNIPKHIFARFEWGRDKELETFTLAAVHLKATPESAEIRQKQSRLLRTWLEPDLNGTTNVIALGDFNSEESVGEERPGSEMLLLRKPSEGVPELTDLTGSLRFEDRWTHLIDKAFDRILVNQTLIADDPQRRDFVFDSIKNYRELVIRGNKDLDHRDRYYQIDADERDVSDHYPLMAEFRLR